VLGNRVSHEDESFSKGLIEYPQYTRPRTFEGVDVPEVLITGHHKNITQYQYEQALEMTKKMRPDLYQLYLNKKV
jgi:tRNA (guanine37-N1)-methyltransferase